MLRTKKEKWISNIYIQAPCDANSRSLAGFSLLLCLRQACRAVSGRRSAGFSQCKRASLLTHSFVRRTVTNKLRRARLAFWLSRSSFQPSWPPYLRVYTATLAHTRTSLFAFLMWREVGRRACSLLSPLHFLSRNVGSHLPQSSAVDLLPCPTQRPS